MPGAVRRIGDLGQDVVDAVCDAFAAGYSAGFWMCCAALGLAAVIAAVGLAGRRADG